MKYLLVLFVLLTASIAEAKYQCLRTTPGSVYVSGNSRRVIFRFANRHTITAACAVRREGYIFWNGGIVCKGGYVWVQNYNSRPFTCRVLEVK